MAAVYQRCREALFNELGVEPSIQTRRLYERLRQDDGEDPVVLPLAVYLDAPAAGEPPFQGLRFFDEGDADRFFGREAPRRGCTTSRFSRRSELRAQENRPSSALAWCRRSSERRQLCTS
jgi:hypothetical protein